MNEEREGRQVKWTLELKQKNSVKKKNYSKALLQANNMGMLVLSLQLR